MLAPVSRCVSRLGGITHRVVTAAACTPQCLYTTYTPKPPSEVGNWDQCLALINSEPVVVIGRAACAPSSNVKAVLDDIVEFVAVEVTDMEFSNRHDLFLLKQSMYELSDCQTFPQVFIGGKFVGGNSDVSRRAFMDPEGLRDDLKAAGATLK